MSTNECNVEHIDWDKMAGLIPAIVQDQQTQLVLMLGYMNREALTQTLESGEVTFYSRSKQRLWTKGETSGHKLLLQAIAADCDQDSLLIQALPQGPTCHLGQNSCFGEVVPGTSPALVIEQLAQRIARRISDDDTDSYTVRLLKKGLERVAQKVGEEGVEVVIAALAQSDEALINESVDLLYHLMVLWAGRDISLPAICDEIQARMV